MLTSTPDTHANTRAETKRRHPERGWTSGSGGPVQPDVTVRRGRAARVLLRPAKTPRIGRDGPRARPMRSMETRRPPPRPAKIETGTARHLPRAKATGNMQTGMRGRSGGAVGRSTLRKT